MKVLINHIGYERTGPKRAVIDAPSDCGPVTFDVRSADGRVCFTGEAVYAGTVDGWKGYSFWSLDFSALEQTGSYLLQVNTSQESVVSGPFSIEERMLEKNTLPDVMNYFATQRCFGRYDRMSRMLPVDGTNDVADVHGGWYDASGDKGQYLSHLSHSIYLNPQQTPLAVWSFLSIASRLEAQQDDDARRLLYYSLMDEAAFGGDFLVRLKSPDGYFYMGIRNADYNDPAKRFVGGLLGDDSFMHFANDENSRKAGFREGAGVAIAALARLSTLQTFGDYDSAAYLSTAVSAFRHLQEHNTEYLYDHRENIADDYCALLAATELFAATGESSYYACAEERLHLLLECQTTDGKYAGSFHVGSSARPFYHPADAGLPVVCMLRFLDIAKTDELEKAVLTSVKAYLDFAIAVTDEVNNPFGYARQLVKAVDAPTKTSFFMPHHNETGYWWQGENAAIASQAAMAFLAAPYFQNDEDFHSRLIRYGIDQLNWILGLNPFDSCMMFGKGRNNRNYFDPLPLVCGGICNGVTGGVDDECDIAFDNEELRDRPDFAWRWTEQWIPHGAWFLLAAGIYSFPACTGKVSQDEKH